MNKKDPNLIYKGYMNRYISNGLNGSRFVTVHVTIYRTGIIIEDPGR